MVLWFSQVFFNEGLAVANQAHWIDGAKLIAFNGEDFRLTSKNHHSKGRLPGVLNLIENRNFRLINSLITYPVSGSFVRYLIDSYGIDLILDFFNISCRNDATQKVLNDFKSVYGISLTDAWFDWIEFLKNY